MRRTAIIILLTLLLAGCKAPKEIVSHTTDTVRVETTRYDSIDRWHTRYVYRQGDTVFLTDSVMIDRWHWGWRDSIVTVHDTTQVAVVQEVERRLTIWQSIRLWAFWPLVAAVVIVVIVAMVRRGMRF